MAAHSANGAHLRLVSTPAELTTPNATSAVQVAERELHIEIEPRACDWWLGTSAQLLAEGVVPQDFEWPKGVANKFWTDGHFEYWVFRRRPDGHKGPQSSYLEVDNWMCRRALAADRGEGFASARIYEKRVALAEELWTHTPAGRQQYGQYLVATRDKAFQDFKALFVPQRKKRGRPSKAESAAKEVK